MIRVMPKVTDDSLFPICEAAKILGINRNSLRKYARNGAINHRTHKGNGRKLFSGTDIKEFWMSSIH